MLFCFLKPLGYPNRKMPRPSARQKFRAQNGNNRQHHDYTPQSMTFFNLMILTTNATASNAKIQVAKPRLV